MCLVDHVRRKVSISLFIFRPLIIIYSLSTFLGHSEYSWKTWLYLYVVIEIKTRREVILFFIGYRNVNKVSLYYWLSTTVYNGMIIWAAGKCLRWYPYQAICRLAWYSLSLSLLLWFILSNEIEISIILPFICISLQSFSFGYVSLPMWCQALCLIWTYLRGKPPKKRSESLARKLLQITY